mmetsp:Transcript_71255/g.170183  ORF Transcript_71255/g.170183 Transcript_71255/m.170183 type:complete len:311 (+) Transcript_71255:311-1243(+)
MGAFPSAFRLRRLNRLHLPGDADALLQLLQTAQNRRKVLTHLQSHLQLQLLRLSPHAALGLRTLHQGDQLADSHHAGAPDIQELEDRGNTLVRQLCAHLQECLRKALPIQGHASIGHLLECTAHTRAPKLHPQVLQHAAGCEEAQGLQKPVNGHPGHGRGSADKGHHRGHLRSLHPFYRLQQMLELLSAELGVQIELGLAGKVVQVRMDAAVALLHLLSGALTRQCRLGKEQGTFQLGNGHAFHTINVNHRQEFGSLSWCKSKQLAESPLQLLFAHVVIRPNCFLNRGQRFVYAPVAQEEQGKFLQDQWR